MPVVRRRLLELFPGIQDWSEDAASSLPDFHAEKQIRWATSAVNWMARDRWKFCPLMKKDSHFVLGVVKVAELNFLCDARHQCEGGATCDVYLQRWQGSEAWFESITSETPELQAKAKTAWQILFQQS